MNNENFEKKIAALKEELAGNDKAVMEKLDDLLLLQKQADVVPVELIIEESEVVKRYPITDAIEIVRCKAAIFVHATCFWAVSKPTLANNGRGGAMFEMLQMYCDYMDNRDKYDEEQQKEYDTACTAIATIFTLPLDVFTDMDFFFGVANDILTRRTEYYERKVEEAKTIRDETVEDVIANAEFEAGIRLKEELGKELEEVKKKKEGVS